MKAFIALSLGFIFFGGALRSAHADALDECVASHEKAQVDFRAAHLIAAKQGLIKCVAACPSEIALDCTTLLQQVESNIPTVVVAATDAQGTDVQAAQVTIDDQLSLAQLDGVSIPLDPGEHRFRIRWPTGESLEQRVVLSEGEKNRRVLFNAPQAPKPAETSSDSGTLPEPSSVQRGKRTASYVLGAASLGFLATFAVFAISGKQKQNEVERCKPYCPQATADAMHSRYLIGDISLGLALATGGLGSYFYFSSGSSSAQASGHAALRVPDRFVVGVQHAF